MKKEAQGNKQQNTSAADLHTAAVAAVAIAFCAVIGILFGSYPAAKASKLQPIDALRAE